MKLTEYNNGIIYGFDITGGETLVQVGLPIDAKVTTMQDVHLIPAPVAAATDAVVQAAREMLGGLEKLTPDDYLTSADMFRGELLIKTLQALDALKEAK